MYIFPGSNFILSCLYLTCVSTGFAEGFLLSNFSSFKTPAFEIIWLVSVLKFNTPFFNGLVQFSRFEVSVSFLNISTLILYGAEYLGGVFLLMFPTSFSIRWLYLRIPVFLVTLPQYLFPTSRQLSSCKYVRRLV